MNDYKCVTDEFEVRGSLTDKTKAFIVKGYAAFKGLDTYGTELSKKALNKIKNSLLTKNVRLDSQHYNLLGDNITKGLTNLKESLSPEQKNEVNRIIHMNDVRQPPLGKATNVEIDDNGVMIEIEINKHLQELNPKYYKAITGMIQDKIFDGLSIEFGNPKKYDIYEDGQRKTIIDDLDLTGVALVQGSANPNTRITEVFARMAGLDEKNNEKMKEPELEEEMRMADKAKELENKEIELLKKELKTIKDELAGKTEALSESEQKAKEEKEKIKSDAEKAEKTMREELDEIKELIKTQSEENKLSSAKGIVKSEDKYGNPDDNSEQITQDDIKKIREEISEKPFGEIIKEAYGDKL